MKITTLRYRTNAPTNPAYKTEHVELDVELGAKDTVDSAFQHAKKEASRLLGIDISEAEIEAAEALLERAEKAGLR